MKGFIRCSGVPSGNDIYIKADRIVLVRECTEEKWWTGEATRVKCTKVEYAGGCKSVLVWETPYEVFRLIEDALTVND